MRGYLGHWDWGWLGPSKAYPYQEKETFSWKKFSKLFGDLNILFSTILTHPPQLNYILYRMAILTFNESHNYT
jgi:hypothetical protein